MWLDGECEEWPTSERWVWLDGVWVWLDKVWAWLDMGSGTGRLASKRWVWLDGEWEREAQNGGCG